ncbi:MAG: helix-turn-helix domain-containing protein [Actinomycetota bacterium]|nr:helix-turn-helix domain-containing protein [Actinomycetota bacterium]
MGERVENSLAAESFPGVLRAAISASGLSLDRVRHHLSRRGVDLSVATLSYWQSGRRRPERAASMHALEQLEDVLQLPPTTLSALLGPPGRQRRQSTFDRFPGLADLWAERPEAAALLSEVDAAVDSVLTRLVQHDRFTIGPNGTPRSVHCLQVMRAEIDDVDRWILMSDWGGATGTGMAVSGLRNCTLGQVASLPTTSLATAELLFERPLRRGETIVIEYEIHNRTPPGGPPPGVEKVSRKFGRPVRQYVLEATFDPSSTPSRCQHVVFEIGAERPKTVRNLEIGANRHAHVVGTDFGPGRVGIRWKVPPTGAA